MKVKISSLALAVLFFLTGTGLAATRFVETTKNANIRSGPSTSSTRVVTADKGDIFQLLGEDEKWYRIRMFSGAERYLYKTLARPVAYQPGLPESLEERREIFNEWKEADQEARDDADRRYSPDNNLERNLNYFQLQQDRKKLEIAHRHGLKPPDLRRVVLEGYFKQW